MKAFGVTSCQLAIFTVMIAINKALNLSALDIEWFVMVMILYQVNNIYFQSKEPK